MTNDDMPNDEGIKIWDSKTQKKRLMTNGELAKFRADMAEALCQNLAKDLTNAQNQEPN